jgi:putative addiction module component (TIGR02574 family)
MSVREIIEQALDLKASDRFLIVDELIKSLDKPDEAIENVWVEEAQKRLQLYDEGKLETVSEEEFFEYAR